MINSILLHLNFKKVFILILTLITLFSALLLVSFKWTKDTKINNIKHNIVNTSQQHFETIHDLQDWFSDNLAKYVTDQNNSQDKISQLTHNKVLKQYSRYSKNFKSFYYHLLSSDSQDKTTLDTFEEKGIQYLHDNPTINIYHSNIDKSIQKGTFDYLAKITIKQSCIQCHADTAVGEFKGAIRITTDTVSYQEKISSIQKLFTTEVVFTLAIAVFLALITYYILNHIFTQNEKLLHLTKSLEKELERNKKQEEIIILQSRHAAMGEMISMIAHQWRQPISVVSMAANNILADLELEMLENQELENTMNDILSQTQYLTQTIDDFRDFFKKDEEPVVTDIVLIIEDALKIIGKTLENNNITLLKEYQKIPPITIYDKKLLQVLINIIKNAKDAFDEKDIKNKQIKIKLYQKENSLFITIHDNAGGISDEIKNKIFEPYFSTKEGKNGTGLGLYMSYTIVQKHLNGNLYTTNSNNGAKFTIRLPLEK